MNDDGELGGFERRMLWILVAMTAIMTATVALATAAILRRYGGGC